MPLECEQLACFGTTTKIELESRSSVLKTREVIPDVVPSTDCCGCNYKITALAELGAFTDSKKNDFTTVLNESPFDSDTIVFKIQKFDSSWVTQDTITDTTYGSFNPKGFTSTSPNLATATINWFVVLNAFGEGFYRIKTEIGSLLGAINIYTNIICLRTYNEANANDTVRFDWNSTGKWGFDLGNGVLYNFGDAIIENSIRIQGYFGNEKTEYEREDIEFANGQIDRVRDEALNIYELTTGLIPATIHDILKFSAFLSDDLKVTDYNTNNDHTISEKSVIMDSGYDPKYVVNRKDSRVVVNFRDKIQNNTRRIC